jgi:hypothetical protein
MQVSLHTSQGLLVLPSTSLSLNTTISSTTNSTQDISYSGWRREESTLLGVYITKTCCSFIRIVKERCAYKFESSRELKFIL